VPSAGTSAGTLHHPAPPCTGLAITSEAVVASGVMTTAEYWAGEGLEREGQKGWLPNLAAEWTIHCPVCGSELIEHDSGSKASVHVHPDRDEYDSPAGTRGEYILVQLFCDSGHGFDLVTGNHKGQQQLAIVKAGERWYKGPSEPEPEPLDPDLAPSCNGQHEPVLVDSISRCNNCGRILPEVQHPESDDDLASQEWEVSLDPEAAVALFREDWDELAQLNVTGPELALLALGGALMQAEPSNFPPEVVAMSAADRLRRMRLKRKRE
jgi:hypothetical protein